MIGQSCFESVGSTNTATDIVEACISDVQVPAALFLPREAIGRHYAHYFLTRCPLMTSSAVITDGIMPADDVVRGHCSLVLPLALG